MRRIYTYLLLCASILACILGVALFIILFVPDFNIYWLILSPIIIALYQAPAAYLFYLYKKARRKSRPPDYPEHSKDQEK